MNGDTATNSRRDFLSVAAAAAGSRSAACCPARLRAQEEVPTRRLGRRHAELCHDLARRRDPEGSPAARSKSASSAAVSPGLRARPRDFDLLLLEPPTAPAATPARSLNDIWYPNAPYFVEPGRRSTRSTRACCR
jgi:hypothetical protein